MICFVTNYDDDNVFFISILSTSSHDLVSCLGSVFHFPSKARLPEHRLLLQLITQEGYIFMMETYPSDFILRLCYAKKTLKSLELSCP